jgi:hypothetical protein
MEISCLLLFVCQRVNTATSSPADDVHHYVIPPEVSRFCFQQTSGIHAPVGKRKGCPVFMRQWEKEKAVVYPVEVPPS